MNRTESSMERTLRLLAIAALDGKTFKKGVDLMSRAGFARNEIAAILGSTPNSVSVRLNELKGEQARKTGRRRTSAASDGAGNGANR